MNKSYPVSIIVPIYKVEKYIEPCLHSLFLQTYPHIEYIFIDDQGNDNSIKILYDVMEKYPHRKEDIRILHHDTNKGLAAARNTGLRASTAEYVLQIDSDDYVHIEMVEKMYEKAIAMQADIVISDYYLEFEDRKIYRKEIENSVENKIANILLRQFQENSPMVWNKLIRRALYTNHNIFCEEGCDLGEDTLVMPQLLYHASRVVHIHEAFVYYVQYNQNSITQNIDAFYGFLVNLQALEEKLKNLSIYDKFSNAFIERKLLITISILCSKLSVKRKKDWIVHVFPKKDTIKIRFRQLHASLFQKIILLLFWYKIEFFAEALLFLFPEARKRKI